jgi:hypothetical protein
MTKDLLGADLNALSSADIAKAADAFLNLSRPEAERPREGYLLDYKQEWNDKALRVVAGFANTFGGLIFVGVSAPNAYPLSGPGRSSER